VLTRTVNTLLVMATLGAALILRIRASYGVSPFASAGVAACPASPAPVLTISLPASRSDEQPIVQMAPGQKNSAGSRKSPQPMWYRLWDLRG